MYPVSARPATSSRDVRRGRSSPGYPLPVGLPPYLGHPASGTSPNPAPFGHGLPALLLRGESAASASTALLRAAVPRLANAELVAYPGLGHTLKPVLDDALDRAAAFLRGLPGR